MKTKKLVIVKGRGTKKETRQKTNITLYWHDTYKKWMSIP